MKEAGKKIHIFWTGGWDSTFRLLQLLNTTNAIVQPHYIIRHENITGIEVYVMTLIRREIFNSYPEVRSRFLPTRYVNQDLIKTNNDIESQITELRKSTKVNEQYRLMANYCSEYGIKEIEVSLDKTPGQTAEEWLNEHFKGISAFDCFRYPVFHLTKYDMYMIAKKNKWDHILSMTSFCRRPSIKIEPCGVCGPCVDTVNSGLGFRLPVVARIKAKLQLPLRKYWRNNYNNNKDTKLFRFIEKHFISKF
jgi:7-cyano-7-deazaguanine synthase in queuosine biosynthesis